MNRKFYSWGGVKTLISLDLRRRSVQSFLFHLLYVNQISYIFWYRINSYICSNKWLIVLKPIAVVSHILQSQWLGFQIPLCTKIGGGMDIRHYSGLIINGASIIGECCTFFNAVTIGREFGGKKKGTPIIGNNVVIFAGAKIIGNVKIGNNVVIGANSVVTKDVPDDCIVAGVPAKIISNKVDEYINHFGYKR